MTDEASFLDGDPKNFEKKFLAYATMNKFKDILKEVSIIHLPETVVSEDSDEITKEFNQKI